MEIQDIRRSRLRQLIRERFRDRQVDLANAIHRNPNYISQCLGGYKPFGEKFARAIEEALRLPSGWLDQHEALADPHPFGPYLSVIAQADSIPVVEWRDLGGTWTPGEPLGHGEVWMSCPTPHGNKTFALRWEGDDMTAPYGRSVARGSILCVDPDQIDTLVSGDLVVARINGEGCATFKQLVIDGPRRYLKPLNPAYPAISAPFELLGKVIASITEF